MNAVPSLLLSLPYRLAAAMARLAAPAVRLPRAPRPQPLGADELQAMSELDLKDLGIGRSEVPHVLGSGPAVR